VDDIALLEDTQDGMKDFTYKTQEEAAKVELLMNPDKCKIMKIGKWNDTRGITIGGKEIETVDAFCYLGSTLTDDSSCDQEITARKGKTNAAFGKLENIIWKSNGSEIKTKIRLCEAVVLSTLLYDSETWPMMVANGRKLDAAHNKCLRRILHSSWRDKITNKEIWKRTGQEDMGNIIRRTRLRWMGHVARMKRKRKAVHAIDWSPEGKRKRGRPRKNWQETIRVDIRWLNMTWSEAINLAEDREGWRDCVAR